MILNDLRVFREEARFSVFSGGTRSGKTWAHLEALIAYALTHRGKLISVVSISFPHLSRGAIRDFRSILEAMKVRGGDVYAPRRWKETSHSYEFASGSIIEFFSADDPKKVHGPQRDILFLNEAQSISYEAARHLFVRTKQAILIDLNPTHRFWVHDLAGSPGVLWVDSTYVDNLQLSKGQVYEIEAGRSSPRWWRVYGEGKIGQMEGLIYPDFEIVDEFPAGVGYVVGLDFGYSIDPTAAVMVGMNSEGWWVKELIYETGLSNEAIAMKLREKIEAGTPVYCDSAEPKSIEALRAMGINALKSDKDINAGIMVVQSKKIHIVNGSQNLLKEIQSYAYTQDKNGDWVGVPAPRQKDHAMDALRYAIFTHFRPKVSERMYIRSTKRTYI
ncbi:MAG: terminase large subunit [Candidatus Caldatribacteriaceae bacterium]